MHDTAFETGKSFFEIYGFAGCHVLDVGSRNVNGSLRSAAPKDCDYTGVDIEPGDGVDLVLKTPHMLPFLNKFDIVVSTSCFEHDTMFWLTFLAMARAVVPQGYLYINVPSAGPYHTYPYDCWRFYPDAGLALETYLHKVMRKPAVLVESFLLPPQNDVWTDFVAVFRRVNRGEPAKDPRIPYLHQRFPTATHIHKHESG